MLETTGTSLPVVEDVLTAVGLLAGVLMSAYLLTWLTWRPERNIDRAMLGHWFRSLIRLYEPGAWVRVSCRRSSLAFAVVRRGGEGDRCWIVVACASGRWSDEQRRLVEEAVERESGALALHRAVNRPASDGGAGSSLPADLSGADVFQVQLPIADIWASESADAAVRVAQAILEALHVPAASHFDLEFFGTPSSDRAFEARRRQLAGELEEW